MPRVRQELLDATARLSRRDRALRTVIKSVGPPDLRRGRPWRTHFAELVRAVCYQQLAGSAARAIHGRLEELLDGEVTPEAVVAVGPDRLRSVGLSGSKARTVSDLAAHVVSGEVELDRVARLADEEIVGELTAVWGIGRWTAEMFLIFQLGRLDVWPVGDYGVRKGYATMHGLAELPSAKELEPLGGPYRPYRSVAAWYCWRAADTVLPTG